VVKPRICRSVISFLLNLEILFFFQVVTLSKVVSISFSLIEDIIAATGREGVCLVLSLYSEK